MPPQQGQQPPQPPVGQLPQPPYGQPPQQPYPAPQPPYNQAPPSNETPTSNALPITGLVLAFLLGPIGLIVSIIALVKNKTNHSGKIMSIVGIVLGALNLLFVLPFFLVLILATTSGVQQKAKDTSVSTSINALQANLEAVYSTTGSYPTLSQLNDTSWRKTNMPGLDPAALSPDPSDPQPIADQPSDSAFGYAVLPTGCQNTTASPCTSFKVGGKLSDGQLVTKQSLN